MNTSLIRYDRTDAELEHFLFFTIAVAGKTGLVMKAAVKRFFEDSQDPSPFRYLISLDVLRELRITLQRHRLGQYNKLTKFVRHIRVHPLNPRTCTLEELMACPGIGPKTARFFLIYTRPEQRVAVLDVHVLAELRDMGHDAPESTPQSPKKYKELEDIVLKICDKKKISPVDWDDQVWRRRSRKMKKLT